ALNTGNSLVQNQPPYYGDFIWGNLNGPLSKTASYFMDGGYTFRQNQNVVNAVDPSNTTANIIATVANPLTGYWFNTRADVQLGKSNTLSLRESINNFSGHNSTVGGLNL